MPFPFQVPLITLYNNCKTLLFDVRTYNLLQLTLWTPVRNSLPVINGDNITGTCCSRYAIWTK